MEQVIEIVSQSEMVLVGIGEEMDTKPAEMMNKEPYATLCKEAEAEKREWCIPFLFAHYLKYEADEKRKYVYENIAKLLEGKNYFIVTLCMDGRIWDSGLNRERIVAPCGGYHALQCQTECLNNLSDASEAIDHIWKECMNRQGNLSDSTHIICPVCGEEAVLNNILEQYDESGYLPQWEKYTKWLQGTLNRRLCVLEAGVGMKYPTVIRWPFEKIAFFNLQSRLIRVHGSLYQLSAGLSDRGVSIPACPLDFFGKKL